MPPLKRHPRRAPPSSGRHPAPLLPLSKRLGRLLPLQDVLDLGDAPEEAHVLVRAMGDLVHARPLERQSLLPVVKVQVEEGVGGHRLAVEGAEPLREVLPQLELSFDGRGVVPDLGRELARISVAPLVQGRQRSDLRDDSREATPSRRPVGGGDLGLRALPDLRRAAGPEEGPALDRAKRRLDELGPLVLDVPVLERDVGGHGCVVCGCWLVDARCRELWSLLRLRRRDFDFEAGLRGCRGLGAAQSWVWAMTNDSPPLKFVQLMYADDPIFEDERSTARRMRNKFK
mmetsp:Transcript_24633/g.52514  ORF Transcript_24633/g.52514 Transcript_24633/m.52514 type:complete len:287 (+) Transcript_24633:231-1091(+)